jgi:DNA polymerase-3 subunit delta'
MSGDSGDMPDQLAGFPHPRQACALAGHHEAMSAILDGLRAGRLHHAWLIGGPEGIGKATFAYHVAKMLLGLKPGTDGAPSSIIVDPDSQSARLVAAQAHPDLVVLRRQPATDKKNATTQIPVETVRRALDVFASTTSAGGWRVCIVDSVEDLNSAGANALLKVLEEPLPRSIFLMVAHQPGKVMPTIRSRCRKLTLNPLSAAEMAEALGRLDLPESQDEIAQAIGFADGSVRRALVRLDPETLSLITGTRSILSDLPTVPLKAAQAMAEQLAGRSGEADFFIFLETVEDWVNAQVHALAGHGAHRLAPLAQVWEKISAAVRETDALNLDRRPVVLSIFHDLADAVMRMRAA